MPPATRPAAGSGSTSWKNGSRSLVASRAALHGRRRQPDGVSQFASAKVVPRARERLLGELAPALDEPIAAVLA